MTPGRKSEPTAGPKRGWSCAFWKRWSPHPELLEVVAVVVVMAEPFLEIEMSKKCTPLWRKARFQVKMYKAHSSRGSGGGSSGGWVLLRR